MCFCGLQSGWTKFYGLSGKLALSLLPSACVKPALSRTDQIALPDFYFGAMENWGLVTYRETNLLYDPVSSSNRNRETTATIIAHELAHMVNRFFCIVSTDWFSHWLVNKLTGIMSGAVVWKPGDPAVVEWGLAERGLCLICGLPGSRPRWACVERGEDTMLRAHVYTFLSSTACHMKSRCVSVPLFAPERLDSTWRRPPCVCSWCLDLLSSSVF